MEEKEALNLRLSEDVLERVAADPAYLEEIFAQAREYRRNYRQLREYLAGTAGNIPPLPSGQAVDTPLQLRALKQLQRLIADLIADRDVATIGIRTDVLRAYQRELSELLAGIHGELDVSELRQLIGRLQARGRLGARQRERYELLAGQEERFVERLAAIDETYSQARQALERLGHRLPGARSGHYGELGEIQTAADLVYRRLEAIRAAHQAIREEAGWLDDLRQRVSAQIDVLTEQVGIQEAPPLYDPAVLREQIDELQAAIQRRTEAIVNEVGAPYGVSLSPLTRKQSRRWTQLRQRAAGLRNEYLRGLARLTRKELPAAEREEVEKQVALVSRRRKEVERQMAAFQRQRLTGQLPPEGEAALEERLRDDPVLRRLRADLERTRALQRELLADDRLHGYTRQDLDRITEERRTGRQAQRLISEHERDVELENAIRNVEEARATEVISEVHGRELIRRTVDRMAGSSGEQTYLPEWRELVGKQVTMAGEAAPFTVAGVKEKEGVVLLRQAHLPPTAVELTLRLAPGASVEEVASRWRNLDRAGLGDYELPEAPQRATALEEKAISVLLPSGKGAAVEIGNLASLVLGLNQDGNWEAAGASMRQWVLSHLPWLANLRHIETESLQGILWLALSEELEKSGIAIDWQNAESVGQALRSAGKQATEALQGRLLRNIIKQVYSEGNQANNAVRDLLSYIGAQYDLSMEEAADVLYRAKERLREAGAFQRGGGAYHLRFLEAMSRRDLIRYGAEIKYLSELTGEAAQEWEEETVEGIDELRRTAERRRELRRLRRRLAKTAGRQQWRTYRAAIEDLLSRHFTSWEESKGTLRRLLTLRTAVGMMADPERGLTLRPPDLAVLRGLVEDVRALSDVLQLEARVKGEPVALQLGTKGDLFAEYARTGERFLVAERAPVIPLPLAANPEDEVALLENIATVRPRTTASNNVPVLVRELGRNWRQLALRQTPAGPVFLGISPDVMLAEFEKLRSQLARRRKRVAVAIDWETTTLLEKLPTVVPAGIGPEELFHPTEVAVTKVALTTGEMRQERIFFRPSQAVTAAAENLLAMLENNPSVLELWSRHRQTQELDFLRNIARYAPDTPAGRGAAWTAELGQPLPAERLKALAEDVRRGLAYLGERGVPLAQGMRRVAGQIRRAPLIIGQNYLQADLAWYNIFAQRVGLAPHPERPLLDLEVLSRYFFPQASSHSLAAQLERLGLAALAGRQHYAAADTELYFRVLQQYLRMPHQPGADLRPVQPGDFVARVRVAAAPGAVGNTEEGRRVRGVYQVAAIDASDRRRVTMTLVPYGEHHPHAGPVTEELGSILEASRRFHGQFAVLSGEEEAAVLADEFFQDRVRREVSRATGSLRHLKELFLYQQGIATPTLELQERYREAQELLQAGKELTPAEEFLLRQYQGVGGTDLADRFGEARAYGLFNPERTRAEELGTLYRSVRRQALDAAAAWLASPEGQAHLAFAREVEGLLRSGLASAQEPANTILRRFNELKRQLAGVRRVHRLWTYDLGAPVIHGSKLERPVVITARNPEYVYRSLAGYARRVIGRAFPDLRPEAAQAELLRHLRTRGFVSEQTSNLYQAAEELFAARGAGRLPQYLVEHNIQPVITTAQDAEALLAIARETILAPLLGKKEQEDYATALQRRMAEHPVAAARFARMQQIRQELGPLAEHPFLDWSQVTSGIQEGAVLRTTGTVSLEEALRPTEELAELVAAGLRQRALGGTPDPFEKTELRRALRSLVARAQQEEPAAVEVLGWSEEAARAGRTLIPYYWGGLGKRTYLRRLEEVAPEDLQALGRALSGRQRGAPARLARYVALYQEQKGAQEQASPAGESVRRANAAIREEAAERVVRRAAAAEVVTEAAARGGLNVRSAAIAAGIGASLLTALALVRPYDKRKATEERAYVEGRPNPPVAEPADHRPLAVSGPANARLEAEGAGVRIAIRGRSRQKVDQQELVASINTAVAREVPQANVNLRLTDQRQSISEESLRQMFGQLLRYGYVG